MIISKNISGISLELHRGQCGVSSVSHSSLFQLFFSKVYRPLPVVVNANYRGFKSVVPVMRALPSLFVIWPPPNFCGRSLLVLISTLTEGGSGHLFELTCS